VTLVRASALGRRDRSIDAARAVDQWFADHPEISVERTSLTGGARGWFAVLQGERKQTIPVYLELGTHNLAVQSFFMRAPDENEAETYEFFLRRNLRTYLLRFALLDSGDVVLVGLLPVAAVRVDELDRLLGQLLSIADEAFNTALRLAFAGYIEREQDWRERSGMSRNPIT
jgi:hypothetical protein